MFDTLERNFICLGFLPLMGDTMNKSKVLIGRIRPGIESFQEFIGQGGWKFKVYRESVSGTEDYTFNLYQH